MYLLETQNEKLCNGNGKTRYPTRMVIIIINVSASSSEQREYRVSFTTWRYLSDRAFQIVNSVMDFKKVEKVVEVRAAARVISAAWRRERARRAAEQIRSALRAAGRIQRAWRRWCAERTRVAEELRATQDRAATRLQAAVRGALVRLLEGSNFEGIAEGIVLG